MIFNRELCGPHLPGGSDHDGIGHQRGCTALTVWASPSAHHPGAVTTKPGDFASRLASHWFREVIIQITSSYCFYTSSSSYSPSSSSPSSFSSSSSSPSSSSSSSSSTSAVRHCPDQMLQSLWGLFHSCLATVSWSLVHGDTCGKGWLIVCVDIYIYVYICIHVCSYIYIYININI